MSEYKRRSVSQSHQLDPHVDASDHHGPEPVRPSMVTPVTGLLHANQPLRRRAGPQDQLGGAQVGAEIDSALGRLRGRGDALPAQTARSMGQAMDADLSRVRIHTGAEPARLARAVQATAFTQGPDIYFAADAYAPHSVTGQRLLAHELAHVVQPDVGGQSGRSATIGGAADPCEAAADRVSARTLANLRRAAPVGVDAGEHGVRPGHVARSIDLTAPRGVLRSAAHQSAEGSIRRKYEPTIAEQQDYTMILQKWGKAAVAAGAEATVRYWCKDHKQFTSLVNNFSWDQFQALVKKYPAKAGGGTKVPIKAADITAHMQKEMAVEVAALAKAKADAFDEQVERFRLLGQPGPGKKLAAYLQEGLMTVEHHSTFRTEDEKVDKEPQGKGPYTRNFAVKVKGVNADWEIHVHYDRHDNVQKAHSKLKKDRHGKEHIRDLGSTGGAVLATTAAVKPATDAQARTRTDF